MDFQKLVQQSQSRGRLDPKVGAIILQLYLSYAESIRNSGLDMSKHDHLFLTLLRLVEEQSLSPHSFTPYHEKIRAPFDYFTFGIEFIRPLVDPDASVVLGQESLKKIDNQLLRGENAIFLANHQTEVDPQLLSIALEKNFPRIGSEVIIVAGDRVITDPLAIPFSMGCNLLCIYSKRHIETPPEKKLEKQMHNQRTMRLMKQLLAEGGKCIYVAPSGGRDRADADGNVEVAPFDPSSIEMFRLMTKQSGKPAHFYPLALATYSILPPPKDIEKELGEWRNASRTGARFAFGDEIDMNRAEDEALGDRSTRREALARSIWESVNQDYQRLKEIR